jgi:hypothetical protein
MFLRHMTQYQILASYRLDPSSCLTGFIGLVDAVRTPLENFEVFFVNLQPPLEWKKVDS